MKPLAAFHSEQSLQVENLPSCPRGMCKVESSDMSEVDIAQATRLHKCRPSKVGVGRLVSFWDGFLLGSKMIYWKVLIKDSILNLQIVETQALGPSFRSFEPCPSCSPSSRSIGVVFGLV